MLLSITAMSVALERLGDAVTLPSTSAVAAVTRTTLLVNNPREHPKHYRKHNRTCPFKFIIVRARGT